MGGPRRINLWAEKLLCSQEKLLLNINRLVKIDNRNHGHRDPLNPDNQRIDFSTA